MTKRLHVISIGGPHQTYHFLPAAFELERAGAADITIFVPDSAGRDVAAELAGRLGYRAPSTVEMRLPRAITAAAKQHHRKAAMLLWWARRLRNADAVLCAERTSALLIRLPGHHPTFIHMPHGSGDRAVGFEKRFSLFDHVLVTGEKDCRRLVGTGWVRPETCHVAGPVKLAAIARLDRDRPPLFDNSRRIILYNPHFDRSLASFDAAAEKLIEQVLADDRYNLVIAPHVRLARSWSRTRIRQWEGRSVPDRLIVDMGSERSIDMSYTLGADCYVGDVSSQVYEFLARPRPCLFINAHDVSWRDDPDYAMWHFGPVVSSDANLVAAVDAAFADHEHYLPFQRQRVALALADNPLSGERTDAPDAIERAAGIIARILGD